MKYALACFALVLSVGCGSSTTVTDLLAARGSTATAEGLLDGSYTYNHTECGGVSTNDYVEGRTLILYKTSIVFKQICKGFSRITAAGFVLYDSVGAIRQTYEDSSILSSTCSIASTGPLVDTGTYAISGATLKLNRAGSCAVDVYAKAP